MPLSSSSGSALILTLLITALLATIAISFLSTSRIEQIAARNFTQQNAASGIAEMATQLAMADIQKGFNSATTNSTAVSILTTQPGKIMSITFPGGNITTTELFPVAANLSGNTTISSSTIDLNQIASNNTSNTTITGNKSESIEVPLAEFTQGSTICRYAFYVDDEGTKLNLNTSTDNRSFINLTPNSVRQTMITAISGVQASKFGDIIDGAGSSTSDPTSDLKNWAFFFRPEQAKGAGFGINATTDIPNITTAASSTLSVNSSTTANATLANSTSSILFTKTPWGTDRLFINTLSTNATDGTGDASVNTIHAALTNSTLTAIFGKNFADKYTSIGVKQIAANMLQMRDPNTFSINASGNYSGALLGGTDLDASNIPREYLGYAPYPVISEIGFSCAFGYDIGIKISVQPTIELYNPYPVDFVFRSGYPRLIIKYSHFAVDINYTLTNGTTATKTFNSTISGDQFPFRFTSIPPNWNPQLNDGSIYYDALFEFLPRTSDNLPYIPAMTKIQTRFGSAGLGPRVHIEHYSSPPVLINSISNMTINIESVRLLANSNNGTGNIQSGQTTTIRDWVSGNETGWIKADISPNGVMPFLANPTTSAPKRGLPYTTLNIPFNNTPTTPAVVPTNSASRISFFNRYPISTIISGIESNWYNPDPGAPTWAVDTSTRWGQQGYTIATNPNGSNSTTSSLSGMSIPSDPSFNNEVSSAVYASTNASDMREPFLVTGNYTCPADLGLVPTNKRWRRLRMQPQPQSESLAGDIPDWAMLDVISFGTNATTSNFMPVNLNGKFHVPTGSPQPAGRDLGIKSLAKAIDSFAGIEDVKIQDIFSNNTITLNRTKFLGTNSSKSSGDVIAGNIANMTWSPNSSWSARRADLGFPSDAYLLPSEIIEIQGVADTFPIIYSGTGEHFKRNEGRISALLPGFTTRSNFFTIYAYGEVGKKVNGSFQEDSRFYTKTLVEVQGTPGNYTVKKLYTQPIPLGQ